MPDILGGLRAHPIRAAAFLGGAVGLGNALATEVGTLLHPSRGGAVLLLWPSINYGPGAMRSSLAVTVFILFVEIAANVLVYALFLAVPVACIVGLRRLLRGSRPTPEDS